MTEVATVPLVTRHKPHDTEVIAVCWSRMASTRATKPSGRAADECLAAFEDYIGFSYVDSVYDYGYYLPTRNPGRAATERSSARSTTRPARSTTLEGAGI